MSKDPQKEKEKIITISIANVQEEIHISGE